MTRGVLIIVLQHAPEMFYPLPCHTHYFRIPLSRRSRPRIPQLFSIRTYCTSRRLRRFDQNVGSDRGPRCHRLTIELASQNCKPCFLGARIPRGAADRCELVPRQTTGFGRKDRLDHGVQKTFRLNFGACFVRCRLDFPQREIETCRPLLIDSPLKHQTSLILKSHKNSRTAYCKLFGPSCVRNAIPNDWRPEQSSAVS